MARIEAAAAEAAAREKGGGGGGGGGGRSKKGAENSDKPTIRGGGGGGGGTVEISVRVDDDYASDLREAFRGVMASELRSFAQPLEVSGSSESTDRYRYR